MDNNSIHSAPENQTSASSDLKADSDAPEMEMTPEAARVLPLPPHTLPGAGIQPGAGTISSSRALMLQQKVGNQAVGRMMQRGSPAVQRQISSPSNLAVQRKDKDNESDKQAGAELQKRATTVSKKFQTGYTEVNSTVTSSLTTIDTARNTYLAYASKYDSAYTIVQNVLKAAKENLELQDKVTDTIIGIAIGVGIGLGVGAVVEAVGVTSLAAKVAWEAAGEAMEAAAAWGVGTTQADKRDAGAKALTDPPGTTPTAVKLEIWQKLAEAYRSAAAISTQTQTLADMMHWADLAGAEALVHKSGGKSEKSLEDIDKALVALEQVAAKQDQLQGAITKLKTSMTQLESGAKQAGAPDERKLEQQIWIEWMSNLPEEASNRLLDTDAIEDHLREVGVLTGDGKSGILKTDFEGWTSKDDTDAARSEAQKLRSDTYRDAFGPQQVGKVVTVTITLGNGADVSAWMVTIPGTRWEWPVDVSPIPDQNMSVPLPVVGQNVRITAYDPASKHLSGIGPIGPVR